MKASKLYPVKHEELTDIIKELLSVLQYPDNGVNYCRWCSAERSSLHKKTCLYVARCNAIEAAKKRAMSVFD